MLIALAWSGFQLYTAGAGALPAIHQRSIHLAFALLLCFFLSAARLRLLGRHWEMRVSLLLAVLAPLTALYLTVFHQQLVERVGDPTALDVAVGACAILAILEASRRSIGLALPLVAAAFIFYAFAGPYLPDLVAHRGYSLRRLVDHLYFTTEGILGIPLAVSSTFVFIFVLLGMFFQRVGTGGYLVRLSFSLLGHTAGGPAKASVLASAFMGTISGSSIANAATTGLITIPLMKRIGLRGEQAAGVETAASGNGQLMPPVMGAAAFVMAEFLGIPYLHIAAAALIPALLDQFALLVAVHLMARKQGLHGLPRDQLPAFFPTLVRGIHYLIPVAVLLYYLIFLRVTPMTAAFAGVEAALGIYLARYLVQLLLGRAGRRTAVAPVGEPKGADTTDEYWAEETWSIRHIIDGCAGAARTMAGIAAACACAGIIVGVVSLTGFGLRLTDIILDISGGSLAVTLVLTMFASLLLGMGIPTTATYIMMATLTAPAILAIDPTIPAIAAHLFVFYFGILADDTPPTGLAAYAAAAIAQADPIRTGIEAFKLDIRSFLLPYMFITAPQLLLVNAGVLDVALIAASAMLGMYALAAAMQGFLLCPSGALERCVLFLAALGLLWPQPLTDVLGLAAVAVIWFGQRRRIVRAARVALP